MDARTPLICPRQGDRVASILILQPRCPHITVGLEAQQAELREGPLRGPGGPLPPASGLDAPVWWAWSGCAEGRSEVGFLRTDLLKSEQTLPEETAHLLRAAPRLLAAICGQLQWALPGRPAARLTLPPWPPQLGSLAPASLDPRPGPDHPCLGQTACWLPVWEPRAQMELSLPPGGRWWAQGRGEAAGEPPGQPAGATCCSSAFSLDVPVPGRLRQGAGSTELP